jgi:hypothetical protein
MKGGKADTIKHGAEHMAAEIMSSEYGVLCTPVWSNSVHICTRIEHTGDRGGILSTLVWHTGCAAVQELPRSNT